MTIRGPFAVSLFVVLGLSLAANFLVAGFVAARFATPRAGGEIERVVAIGVRAFPAELRREIEQRARRDRDPLRQHYDALREARRRMFNAMHAEPFDRAALEAAFAEVRSRTNDLQTAGQDIVAGALAEASPGTRRRIRMPHGPFR